MRLFTSRTFLFAPSNSIIKSSIEDPIYQEKNFLKTFNEIHKLKKKNEKNMKCRSLFSSIGFNC